MTYDPDPVEHEQAVLRMVRERLSDDQSLGDRGGKQEPWIFHDIRLQGEHPETRLVIDLARGTRYRDVYEWKLWDPEEWGGFPPGFTTVPPEEIFDHVMVLVYEF